MAHRCGDDTAMLHGRLTLNPMAHLDLIGTLLLLFVGFGWAKPVPVDPSNFRHARRDDVLVSLAGVTCNFLSAIGFALILRLLLFAHVPLSASMVHWFIIAIVMNLGLILFNLLPIPPLDGSHVLRNMLPWDLRMRFDEIARYGGMILLLVLLLDSRIGILSYVIGPPIYLFMRLLTLGL